MNMYTEIINKNIHRDDIICLSVYILVGKHKQLFRMIDTYCNFSPLQDTIRKHIDKF